MHNDRQQFSLQKETELQALAVKLEEGAAIEVSLAAQLAEAKNQTLAVRDELNTAKQLQQAEIERRAILEAEASEARILQSRVKEEWADRQQEIEALKIRREDLLKENSEMLLESNHFKSQISSIQDQVRAMTKDLEGERQRNVELREDVVKYQQLELELRAKIMQMRRAVY